MDNIEEILVRSLPEEKYLRNFFKDRDVIETCMYMYLLNQVTFCEEMVQVLICWNYSGALILYFGVKLHMHLTGQKRGTCTCMSKLKVYVACHLDQ